MSAARRPRPAVNSCGLSRQSCLAHPSQWTRPRVTAMRLPLLLPWLTVVSIACCKRNYAVTASVNTADSLSRSQALAAPSPPRVEPDADPLVYDHEDEKQV